MSEHTTSRQGPKIWPWSFLKTWPPNLRWKSIASPRNQTAAFHRLEYQPEKKEAEHGAYPDQPGQQLDMTAEIRQLLASSNISGTLRQSKS